MSSAKPSDFPFPVFRDPSPESAEDPISVSFDEETADALLSEADGAAFDPGRIEVRQRIAQIEKEAYEKAFVLGEKSGRELGEKSVVPLVDKLRRYLDELSRLRKTLLREAERETVELAVQIARAIVEVEVERHPEAVMGNVRKALERLGGEGKVTLRVHPVDASIVWAARESLSPYLDANGELRVEPDEGIDRGGCLAVTDFTEADATIAGQFEAIREQLANAGTERK